MPSVGFSLVASIFCSCRCPNFSLLFGLPTTCHSQSCLPCFSGFFLFFSLFFCFACNCCCCCCCGCCRCCWCRCCSGRDGKADFSPLTTSAKIGLAEMATSMDSNVQLLCSVAILMISLVGSDVIEQVFLRLFISSRSSASYLMFFLVHLQSTGVL